MSHVYQQYLDHITRAQARIFTEQLEAIDRAATLMANAIASEHTVYAFGASHAGIITEELFYRTGGLALINPLFNPTLMLNTRPVTLTSEMERLEGFGTTLFDSSALESGDVLILHSVSGRNPVSIDLAAQAQRNGVHTVVITNMAYSQSVSSRHSSGKRLYDYGEVVIDNCGDIGDSCVSIEGVGQKVAPTSSIIGCMIANMIVIKTVELLKESNIEPPVFRSANIDGGDAFNAHIFEKYKDQIHYL